MWTQYSREQRGCPSAPPLASPPLLTHSLTHTTKRVFNPNTHTHTHNHTHTHTHAQERERPEGPASLFNPFFSSELACNTPLGWQVMGGWREKDVVGEGRGLEEV